MLNQINFGYVHNVPFSDPSLLIDEAMENYGKTEFDCTKTNGILRKLVKSLSLSALGK